MGRLEATYGGFDWMVSSMDIILLTTPSNKPHQMIHHITLLFLWDKTSAILTCSLSVGKPLDSLNSQSSPELDDWKFWRKLLYGLYVYSWGKNPWFPAGFSNKSIVFHLVSIVSSPGPGRSWCHGAMVRRQRQFGTCAPVLELHRRQGMG